MCRIKSFKKENKHLLKSNNIEDKLLLNDNLNELHCELNIKGYVKKFRISNNIVGNDKLEEVEGDIMNLKYNELLRNGKEIIEDDIDFDNDYTCCCGKTGLKYLYVVEFKNGKSLLVGSQCIKKYNNDDLNNQVKTLTSDFENKDKIKIKLGKEIDICKKCVNYRGKCGLCKKHYRLREQFINNELRFCLKSRCKNITSKKKCLCMKHNR